MYVHVLPCLTQGIFEWYFYNICGIFAQYLDNIWTIFAQYETIFKQWPLLNLHNICSIFAKHLQNAEGTIFEQYLAIFPQYLHTIRPILEQYWSNGNKAFYKISGENCLLKICIFFHNICTIYDNICKMFTQYLLLFRGILNLYMEEIVIKGGDKGIEIKELRKKKGISG